MSNYVTTHSSEMTLHEESCFRIYNERNSYLEINCVQTNSFIAQDGP